MGFERLVLSCIDVHFWKSIINIRWKALDEIYQIYILLHLSDRKFQQIFVTKVGVFNIRNAKTNCIFSYFSKFVAISADLNEICSDFNAANY